MAEHKIEAGQVGSYENALVATTVDTIKVEGPCEAVEVTNNSGSKTIYVTTDGSTPTVKGATTRQIPAAVCTRKFNVHTVQGETATVKLISEGTPTYSVARAGLTPRPDLVL